MADYVLRDYATLIFTDASMTECVTGSGVFSDVLDISVSFRLANVWSVSSGEICVINEKVDECAVRESSLHEDMTCNRILTSLVIVSNKFENW